MKRSNGDRRLDVWMAFVGHDFEVFELVFENRRRPARDFEPRQGQWRTTELFVSLLQVIQVKMAVPARPDEFTGLEVALLREHVRQQRVRGDIEGHA